MLQKYNNRKSNAKSIKDKVINRDFTEEILDFVYLCKNLLQATLRLQNTIGKQETMTALEWRNARCAPLSAKLRAPT